MGEERVMFTLSCQLEWETLPPPDAPLTIGIDSGYVRGREGNNHKAGNFEVIVGKSMPHEGPNKRFGFFVNGYDTRPKRRLFELLKSQGMQFGCVRTQSREINSNKNSTQDEKPILTQASV